MSQSSPENLRRQLRAVLDADSPDYDKFLELSSQFAALDPDNIRFTADGALIDRLGLQLVARQETAVSELVKNAYDADALNVRLVFSSRTTPGGRLIISDDGSGMRREELVSGFMRLASSEKVREPISPLYKRQRAGRKGIGRFAVQRLGRRLTLITQVADEEVAYKIEIDWDKFATDKNLFSVGNKIEVVPKERPHGTMLVIDDLREGWSDAQISRVYRYVEDLLQPPLPSGAKRAASPKAQQFTATFFRNIAGKDVAIASEETMVTNYALATVSAEVGSDGVGTWHIESKKLKLDERGKLSPDPDKPDAPYEFIRNVRFFAHFFIIASEYVPGQEQPRLRRLAERAAGIRLYRNGFRVLPYGESKNDWLGLDEITRRRVILAPVHNRNWMGYIEINDVTGELFEETSSREGIKNNEAFEELTQFGTNVAMLAASRIQEVRGKKVTAGQRDYRRAETNFIEELAKAAENLEKEAKEVESMAVLRPDGGEAVRKSLTLANLLRDSAEQGKELFEENGMLRVLASLGLTIGVFTHEVSLGFIALEGEMRALLARGGIDDAAREAIRDLKDHFRILQSYTAYFDKTISENVSRERVNIEVNWAIHDFIREFSPVAERDNIIFTDTEIDASDLITPPMHPSEWASILANLFTNSRKAIRRCNNLTEGRIRIKAVREGSRIVIDFCDNGDGIPSQNRDRVFNAFFTTTHLASDSSDRDLAGTGLGLKIVKDIIESADGEIYVTDPPPSYSTCMRIELPAAEMPES